MPRGESAYSSQSLVSWSPESGAAARSPVGSPAGEQPAQITAIAAKIDRARTLFNGVFPLPFRSADFGAAARFCCALCADRSGNVADAGVFARNAV